MNTRLMPVCMDCGHLGFNRQCLNPGDGKPVCPHFYELDKEENNSFYVRCWRKLYSEHLHMMSLEVSAMLSPAFDRGDTRAPDQLTGSSGRSHACLAPCLEGVVCPAPSLSSPAQSLLSDLEIGKSRTAHLAWPQLVP